MPNIKISIERIRCNEKENNFQDDDLYYVSTLRCGGLAEDPQLEDPLPLSRIRKTSDVKEFDSGEEGSFDPPDDVLFEGNCPSGGAVTGSVYFFDKEGDSDITLGFSLGKTIRRYFREYGDVILAFALALGFVGGLAAGVAAALLGAPPPLAVGIGLLGALATGFAVYLIGPFVGVVVIIADSIRLRDDFIGGIPLSVPVDGGPSEPVPGSPFKLSGDQGELRTSNRRLTFDASNKADYDVFLRVERG